MNSLPRTKVLFILPEYSEKSSSHQLHLTEMLGEWQKRMEVIVLVERARDRIEVENVSQVYVQKISLPILNLLERLTIIALVRLCGCKKTYVYYSYLGAILASLVFRLTGGVVYYWHCEVYDQFFSKFKLDIKTIEKKLTDEWLMVIALKLVNFLVTGTPTVARFYKQTFNLPLEKIKVIPNWVNISRFRLKKTKQEVRGELDLPKDKKIVLFLHRLAPRKGADLLPEIISLVASKVQKVYFLIAGDGPLREYLIEKIRDSKLDDFSRVLGAVPNTEVPKYLADSDLYIAPSRQEGFNRVLLEAMAAGVPFVSFDVGGTKDVLTDLQNKYLVPRGDISGFCKRLVELLNKPLLRKQLINEGYRQVKKYGLEKVAKEYYRLFRA